MKVYQKRSNGTEKTEMKDIVKKNLFWILIIAVTLFTFWDLPKTFYQQDEWQSLGHNLAQGLTPFFRANPLLVVFGELRPLSTIMYVVLLGFFKFTVVPAAIFAIISQIINGLLIFYLVDKIAKNKLIAFLAALFFITNSISHQAVTWASAIGTVPAVTFILVAIIYYLKYFEKESRSYLLIGLISIILSLLFKGVGLFLFILLPSMFFIYQKKSINKKNIADVLRINGLLLVFGFLMILVRLGQFFLRTENVAGYVNLDGSSSVLQAVFLRAILYPLTSLFQIYVPPLDLYSVTPAIAKIQYKYLVGSPLVDLIAQSIVADMIAIFGAFMVLGILVFIYKYRDRITKRNIIFALLFFFLSFLTYVFTDRDSSYLSSRYFYVGAIPAGILFGYIAYFLVTLGKYSKWIVFPIVFLFLFHHASIIRKDINYQVNLGNERKAVLNGIKELKPTLDNQTIFYITSDKQYYGSVTNPFQNGLGYVLEVWYWDSGKIPKEFLSENFLWDLGSEGYKSSDDKGFGYFQDVDKMVTQMEKNKLKPDVVSAFFIKSKEQEVIDITKETRERISTISAITQND